MDKAAEIIEQRNKHYNSSHRRFVLLKDLVVPAGTVFEIAPTVVENVESHFSATIGLTNDTHGDLTYDITGDDFDKLVGSGKWFAEMNQDVREG